MADNPILTSLADLQQLLKGSATSQSLAILNNVMAETIGMSMHNAVTAQHNAQMLNSATTTSTCAKILSVIGAYIPTPPPPTPPPSVTPPANTPSGSNPSPASSVSTLPAASGNTATAGSAGGSAADDLSNPSPPVSGSASNPATNANSSTNPVITNSSTDNKPAQ